MEPNFPTLKLLDFLIFRLNMRIYYDNNLVKTFGSEDEAEVRIKAVVAHAQTYFKMPSLTTTININLMSLKHLNMTWGASEENVELVEHQYIFCFVCINYGRGEKKD